MNLILLFPEDYLELYDFHFLLMDNDSYRFKKERKKHVAVAAFGDPEGANNLSKIFESLWEASSSVELPQLKQA